MTTTITVTDQGSLGAAAKILKKAKKTIALTGAGISVESGIDDFRSPGGLWSRYPVTEYGTIDVFKTHPEMAWELFHVIIDAITGKIPNAAHKILFEMEKQGRLDGIITQNIDGLHQLAGNTNVVEIHGGMANLRCLHCGFSRPVQGLDKTALPECDICSAVLKPDVVMFGEQVQFLEAAEELLHGCDLLLVIGTSAQVLPVADMPRQVKMQGGKIFEFNLQPTPLTQDVKGKDGITDVFFQGRASVMLDLLT